MFLHTDRRMNHFSQHCPTQIKNPRNTRKTRKRTTTTGGNGENRDRQDRRPCLSLFSLLPVLIDFFVFFVVPLSQPTFPRRGTLFYTRGSSARRAARRPWPTISTARCGRAS